jgi:hypothetical protein
MDADLNKYDLNHAVTAHPKMSQANWEETYRKAWETYYTDEHIETVLRRAIATGTSPGKTMFFITWFKGCIGIEKIHPLEGGFLRRRFRRSRRSGLALENPLTFYPKNFIQAFWKQLQWISLYLRLRLIYNRLKKDSQRFQYEDLSLVPVTDDETLTRELFQSEEAQAYIGQRERLAKMTRGEAA